MTTDALTYQDRVDLVKLAKALAIKSAQIIIQSRDGSKAHTRCNPNAAGHATFNLAFREMLEVDKEAKRAMSATHGDRWSLCIEIFLKTVEGDVMTLETWNISLVPGFTDNSKLFTLYGRLGILLKSLLAITRVVPAYRYSRRQNPDSWMIDHRMYVGEPMCNSLGDKYKQLKVGSVSTPIGLLQVSVAYRTNMTISPQPSGIDTSVLLKSDHFKPDFSPNHGNRNHISDDNSTSVSEESSYKMGAFVNSRRESLARSDTDQLLPTVPFGSLLNAKATSQQQTPTNAVNGSELCERLKAIELEKDDANGNVPVTKSVSSCNDDFIVVDLVKPPFAEPSGNIELGTFYREWKSAPPLQACPSDPKVIDQVGDLTSQLAIYETSLKEFDSVVTDLCNEEKDSNDNMSPFES